MVPVTVGGGGGEVHPRVTTITDSVPYVSRGIGYRDSRSTPGTHTGPSDTYTIWRRTELGDEPG